MPPCSAMATKRFSTPYGEIRQQPEEQVELGSPGGDSGTEEHSLYGQDAQHVGAPSARAEGPKKLFMSRSR